MKDSQRNWYDGLSPRTVAAITILGYAFVVWAFWDLLVITWERFGLWSFIPLAVIAGLALIPLGPIALAIAATLIIGFLFGPWGIAASILVCLILLLRRR